MTSISKLKGLNLCGSMVLRLRVEGNVGQAGGCTERQLHLVCCSCPIRAAREQFPSCNIDPAGWELLHPPQVSKTRWALVVGVHAWGCGPASLGLKLQEVKLRGSGPQGGPSLQGQHETVKVIHR